MTITKFSYSFQADAVADADPEAFTDADHEHMPCRQAVAWKALKELARPALHAQTLGFTHPITGARMQFTSDLPADFQQTLSYLTQLV